MSSWPELRYMQVQVNSLSDDAESLKLITFGPFLFWVAENRKSAPAEKSPKSTAVMAAVQECRFELVRRPPRSPDLTPSHYYLLL